MDATQGANDHYNMTSRVTVGNTETDVLSALNTLIVPGAVTELRLLGTGRGSANGYYDNLEKMAADAARHSGSAVGVFMTLNRVDTRLTSRSHNRLAQPAKNTTADTDITRRLWLPIGFDPVRRDGISSTDEEHHCAIERARMAQTWLLDMGFPEVILADSGNGADLLIRVDQPNDGKSLALIKGCLGALDFLFGDELVRVDTMASSAALIWPVYGTLVCKGENLPHRPHRRASILHKPTELVIAGADLLEKLAAIVPQTENSGVRRNFSSPPANMFDVDAWIKGRDIAVSHTSPWEGGRKWVLQTCPWDPQHADHAAYILQRQDGLVSAGCHHQECAGNGWKELRALYHGVKADISKNIISPGVRREGAEAPVAPPRDHVEQTVEARDEWPELPGEATGEATFAGHSGQALAVVGGNTEADQGTEASSDLMGLSYPGVEYNEESLTLPENLPYDEWVRIGKTLDKMEKSIQWARGDWWAFGERKWGDKSSNSVTGKDYDTVRHYGWVARTFPSPENRSIVLAPTQLDRRPGLSFSQHFEVAPLVRKNPALANELLDKAEQEKLTTRQLRQEVKWAKYVSGRTLPPQQKDLPMSTLGPRKYDLILADPPWQYDFVESEARAIENQYPTMSVEAICAVPVQEVMAEDCVLLLWAMAPKILEALKVMEAWGFQYRTHMVWVKDLVGMGYYVRNQHELLLIGKRGDVPVPREEDRPSSVVHAPRTRHSKKPAEFYEHIEAMFPDLEKIELFSRSPRESWMAWGLEVSNDLDA